MPWDYSIFCLKYTDVVPERKPINFCYLPIRPYLHIFLQSRCVHLSIQALLQVILNIGSVQSCLLYKCNVSVKLVIMKVSIMKS